MSTPDSTSAVAPVGAGAMPETRIDAAHLLIRAQPEPPPVKGPQVREKATVATETAGAAPLGEQIRAQAVQLAEYLRGRQRDLDHRESQLHAQLARLENEARSERMSLNERAALLEEKARELKAREDDIVAAEAERERGRKSLDDLARREEAVGLREKQLDVLAASLRNSEEAARRKRERAREALRYQKQKIDTHREASQQLVRQMLDGVERRRRAAEAEAARLREQACQPSPELLQREEQLREATRALEARQEQLDQAEALAADARAEADKLREQLAEDRRTLREQARAERRRMAAAERFALAELEAKRESLERRSEHVDECQTALEQLRSELETMHRETLEIRLATEELRVQLSGSASPATTTRSLEKVRAKLADHYRAANAELAEKGKELRILRNRLAEEHQKLLGKKEEFEQWAADRQQEIEGYAQRLIAREEEMERQEAVFNELTQRWQTDQLRYQQEIRRLKAQQSEMDATLAPA
ncbi:MAG: hypothetical protein ABIP48_11845 [Planctomycetota bacterium]